MLNQDDWRLMEEFQNIVENAPLWPGDTISHQGLKELEKRGLVRRDYSGNVILTKQGEQLLNLWQGESTLTWKEKQAY